jgi:hypothetical protein
MSDDLSEQWREWARGQQIPAERVEAAVEIAVRLGAARASQAATAAAARIVGGRATANDVALIREEARRDDLLLAEIQRLTPWGRVTAEALADLTELWTSRRQALGSALDTAAPARPAPAPRPPAPTLGEFISEHGILLLSYTGAFLLVVATVLYELYGVTGLSGGMRFGGVLGLDLVFGVAGWACLSSRRMRLVGHTYVAIFALIAPLVFVAAYVFLELRQHGIGVELAQLLTGASLTMLYAILATRLRSHAYGLLALTALPVAWLGGIDLAGAGPHNLRGPVFAGLVPVYVAVAAGARRVDWLGGRFATYATLYVHGAAVLALGLTAYDDIAHEAWRGWTATAALAVAGAGYALDRLLGGRPAMLLPAALATSLAVLAANAPLGFDVTAAAIELVVLAAAWGLAAEGTHDDFLRPSLRTGLAVQALIPALLVTRSPHETAAAVMAASAALLALAAWRIASPYRLLMAGAAAGIAWYWTVRIPASVPAHVVFADTVFPAAAGLAGLAVRAGLGRRWALPLYSAAAIAAVVVALAAFSQGDIGLLGRSLLAYAVIAYAAAAVERSAEALTGAVLTAAAGLIAVLADRAAPHLWYPVAIAALALAVYTGELWWQGSGTERWLTTHRVLGLAGMSLAAASAFLLPGETGPRTAGALLAVAGFLVLGGLLAVDGQRHGLPIGDYAAVTIASLATFFAARWFGADNPQWYVAVPGLALLACGLRLPHDPRLAVAPANAQLVTALGAALLLGTTAVQAFSVEGWAYTGVLVAEGVIAIVAGIGLRSRVLVVAGAAAVGGGGLRALFVLVQQGLLFVAFGTAALVLLAAGAALALLRERLGRAGGSVGAAWREWM